ncbi:hypothetical protein [Roseovarius mucosus]|uniref:hypothetical protein n=1 Tax=Roseovarius mucosus TaxID=215743 RepID=UPI0035CF91E5
MADKPILFSAPMIRALLDGRKTQTRRVLKPQPGVLKNGIWYRPYPGTDPLQWCYMHGDRPAAYFKGSYAPGDRLWVKETWRPSISAADPWHVAVLYPHTGDVKHWNWSSDADFGDWKIPKAAATGNVTPLFMPRWASRLTLIVTEVRVQRLQDISDADAWAEGCRGYVSPCGDYGETPREEFHALWNSLHGPDAWDANPWVVALTLDVYRSNIDQMGDPA